MVRFLRIDPIVGGSNPASVQLLLRGRREGQVKRSVFDVRIAPSGKVLAH